MAQATMSQTIPLEDISVGKRLRVCDPSKVKELKINIADIGLIHPISVKEDLKNKGKYKLVAGTHRFQAYTQLKEEHGNAYEAIPVSVIEEDKALQVELSENFFRNDLTVLEKSEHLDKYLKSQSTDTVSAQIDELAKMSESTERTLYRYKKIGSGINDKTKQMIKALDNGLANSTRQLEYLATKCSSTEADNSGKIVSEQQQVVELIKDNPDLKVQEAHKKLKGEEKPAKEKMASVRVPNTVKSDLENLAKEKEMPEKEFTQAFLEAALVAYKGGTLSL